MFLSIPESIISAQATLEMACPGQESNLYLGRKKIRNDEKLLWSLGPPHGTYHFSFFEFCGFEIPTQPKLFNQRYDTRTQNESRKIN